MSANVKRRLHAVAKTVVALSISAVLLLLNGCVDMGAGDDDNDFKNYFSFVVTASHDGVQTSSIASFNKDIGLDDEEIDVVIPSRDYCYIGFRVKSGYTITVDEFAFFAKTDRQEDLGTLIFDMYVTDAFPTKIKKGEDDNTYLPELDDGGGLIPPETDSDGNVVERDNEVEDNIFEISPAFATGTIELSYEWNSVLLEFGQPQTARGGQYIVVRARNNCYISETGRKDPMAFTFNRLMFYFSDVKKP